jgi:thiosulfate/3-mercaptopyruvate sulfurtransferase
MTSRRSILWTCAQLQEKLGQVKVLDATWIPPFMSPRNFKAEFLSKRIPTTQYFDVNEISDIESPFPHMLPSPQRFEACMDVLGVNENDDVCIYDNSNMFLCGARAWWMFLIFGHKGNISILRGGVDQWEQQGFTSETTPSNIPSLPTTTPTETRYKSTFDKSLVKSFEEMKAIVRSKDLQIVDARSQRKFEGLDPEPRPNMRSGHLPGSINVPFTTLFSNNDINSDEKLLETFQKAGIDFSRPIVTTCGAGLSAAIINLSLWIAGHTANPPTLYDGSWTEWGSKKAEEC